jgi:hypothetical protein
MDTANQRASSMLDEREREHMVELLGAVRAAYVDEA